MVRGLRKGILASVAFAARYTRLGPPWKGGYAPAWGFNPRRDGGGHPWSVSAGGARSVSVVRARPHRHKDIDPQCASNVPAFSASARALARARGGTSHLARSSSVI